jgi:hypothetical protein
MSPDGPRGQECPRDKGQCRGESGKWSILSRIVATTPCFTIIVAFVAAP